MIRELIATIMVVVMLFFSGCGQSKDNKTSSTASQSVTDERDDDTINDDTASGISFTSEMIQNKKFYVVYNDGRIAVVKYSESARQYEEGTFDFDDTVSQYDYNIVNGVIRLENSTTTLKEITNYYYEIDEANSSGTYSPNTRYYFSKTNAATYRNGTVLDGLQFIKDSRTDNLKKVILSSFGYMAVGEGGVILTSNDGITWTAQTSGTTNNLESVIWNGLQYVAVGGDLHTSESTILTSSDGVTWRAQTAGTTSYLNEIIWDGFQYMAVGSVDNETEVTILTSNDGIKWTTQSVPIVGNLSGVAWSGSRYVAVGENGNIITSDDNITWTAQASGTANNLLSVTWSGSQFVVSAGSLMLTSRDGIIWRENVSGATNAFKEVVWNGSLYMAVGTFGIIYTSVDGINWTAQTSGTTIDLDGITCNGTQYVIVGNGIILTSF